jgi:hypothetical protein
VAVQVPPQLRATSIRSQPDVLLNIESQARLWHIQAIMMEAAPRPEGLGLERLAQAMVSGELPCRTRLVAAALAPLKGKTVLVLACGSDLSRLLTTAITPE